MLSIKNIEKHSEETILFPAFSLTLEKGEIVAIHSNLNVRHALIHMFMRKTKLTHGEISILGQPISENKTVYPKQIAVSSYEEGLYDRLSIMDHFKFYEGLYGSNQKVDKILQLTHLYTIRHKRIKNLTDSQKKRINFARVLIQDPSFFIFEEPDLNVDVETRKVFLNITKYLQDNGKGILILTGNIESAIMIADHVYRLHDQGLQPYELAEERNQEEKEIDTDVSDNEESGFQFNKIPTKVNDKIVLFDPPEIDYIESSAGQSTIFIKGEAFQSMSTLNELEKRLIPFGFFRCHRSYIVNLQKVREVIPWTKNSYSLVLDDKPKSSIPLSKSKMVHLKEMLGLK
ncbi:LytTR family transcriptional regulator DNA-binding domain-containing protein [Oceanobacillus limi]|uniref:LytTR family transcriptional regulator DNA-binding domain-containing protein n=1 Tax=Oceanobacillus limi TaxID=930131 RepID=UPI001FCD29DC|nr:LytTR family transcriptional regulator DNA-binding domain-containing protein [Oceanobacillus limi]